MPENDIQGGLDAAVPVKANSKGGVSPLGSIAMDPTQTADLLKRMQEMIAERESPLSKLMSGLKDASAAGSGGIQGPTAALQLRDEQKAKDAQELFNMRSQMATLRSAQGQQELLKNQYESLNPPAGAAAPTTGGTAAGTSPIPGLTLQQFTAIKNDPYVQSQLETLAPNDYAGKLAIIREAAKTEFGAAAKGKYEAAGNKQEAYTIPGIGKNGGDGTVMMTSNEKIYFDKTRTLPDGTVVPKNIPVTAAAVSSTTPATTGVPAFNDPSIKVTSAQRTAQKQQELWDTSVKNGTPGVQPNGTPVAKPGTSPHETQPPGTVLDIDPKTLTTAGRTELAQKGYYQPYGKDSPHWAKIPPVQTTTSTISAAGAPQLRDYPNKAAYDTAMDLYKKSQEKELDIAGKGPEQASTEAGKRRAKMFELADATDNTVKAADMAIAASTSHPEATGIGKGRTAANALVTAAGTIVPKMDKSKAEDQYAALTLSDEGNKAREAIVGSSKQLGIDFAANVFKGARMGIGLENMAANAKNVSEHNTAETNIINAKIIKEAALFNKARAQLYNQWAPNNGGALANFEKFETSPEYQALAVATQEKIAAELPQYLKLGKNGLEEVSSGKKSSAENGARAELERRKKAKESQ